MLLLEKRVAVLLFGLSLPLALVGQSAGSMFAPARGSAAKIPRYLIYRHFLGWVNSFQTAAGSDGQAVPSDSSALATSIASAYLSNAQMDVLLSEARAWPRT